MHTILLGYHNDFKMYGIAINIELLKIWNIVVPNKLFSKILKFLEIYYQKRQNLRKFKCPL
jgi:hypothetical protein